MGYLTPDSVPGSVICRALFIPNDEAFLAIVRGALQELTFASSWTKDGALTEQEAADACVDMFDRFCFAEGPCRMIGEIIAYAGLTSPKAQWLECDGSEIAQVTYPDLYAVIGDTYGSAASGNFRLPDLRGRTATGAGTGASIPAVAVGDMFGEASHTLTENEMPSHVHAYDPVVIIDVDLEDLGLPQGNAAQIVPLATENTYATGGGAAHNNLPPRLGILYLIVAKDG